MVISELRRFLTATEGQPFSPLWVLAAGTGMRRGELLALRWSQVDLEAGVVVVVVVVVVERSVTSINRKLHYVTTKNHERREVPIDSRTTAQLRAWRRRLHPGPRCVQ